MKFKESIYNIIVETRADGKNLVFNTASGILGLMDKQTQELYSDINNVDYYNLDPEDKERLKKLIQANCVVDDEIDEVLMVKVRRQIQKYQTDFLELTIAPTMGCNMACPYCYENKNNYVMDESVQDSVIKFINAINGQSSIKNLHVTWYGGEPLLAKNVIFELSSKIIKFCDNMNIDYACSMISNGTLLDLETTKILVEKHRLKSVQITIDGMAETHNIRRRLISGGDSFGVIINNIQSIKDILNINVRVNVDKSNLTELPVMIDYFLNQLQWRENPRVYFAPVANYSDNCKTEDSVCIASENFAELEVELARQLYEIDRSTIVDRLFPQPKTIHCGAETKNNYVIDPKGFLYHCWLNIGEQSHASGHISAPYRISKEDAGWLLSDLDEKCYNCKFIPICQGGCAHYRINNNGDAQCARSCFNYKEMLQLACEDYLLHRSK